MLEDDPGKSEYDDGDVNFSHQGFPWRMILSENRFPLFGIMR